MSRGQLSWEGRQKLAATPLREGKLAELTGRMSPSERRCFWLGVLLLDQAVSLDDALKNFEPGEPIRHADGPPPVSSAGLMVERKLRVVREPSGLCECGRPVRPRTAERGPAPTTCDSWECPRASASMAVQDRKRRRQERDAAAAD